MRGGRFANRNSHQLWPPLPLGPLIREFRATELESKAAQFENLATITDVGTVVSFNLLGDREQPTIAIPGAPRLWTPPDHPARLHEDQNSYFIDINAAHYEEHPMEPAVVASLDAQAGLPRTVDIVACNSTLGNLLRFLRGEKDKDFRMLAENVHGTLFLTRREVSPKAVMQGLYGYGHTFPDAYTSWYDGLGESVSHQRVICYRFGNLRLLVRCGADGCLKDETEKSGSDGSSSESSKAGAATTTASRTDAVDELAARLNKVSVAANTLSGANPRFASGELRIEKAGRQVDRSRLFDLKTRTIRKIDVEDTFANEIPRLWVAQIPWFILAYHTKGKFSDENIHIQPVAEKIEDWERTQKKLLSRLAALLHHLVDTMCSMPDHKQKMEICHPKRPGAAADDRSTNNSSSGGGNDNNSDDEKEDVLEFREQLPDVPSALSAAAEQAWEKGMLLPASDDETETGSSEDSRANEVDDCGSVDLYFDRFDEGDELDYTACSYEDCGYCGRCSY